MDPTENLERQLEAAQFILDHIDDGDYQYTKEEYGEALAELVLALNEWIQKGGFLPKQWERSKP